MLTDAGQLLVARAEEIIARLQDTEAELLALAGLEGGRLRLASFASAAASIVPLAIARFRERYPAVELSIVMADPIDSIPRLRAGELDMALSHDATFETVGERSSAVGIADGARSGARATSSSSTCSTIRCTWRCRSGIRSPATTCSIWRASPTSRGCSRRRSSCPDSRRFLRACHAAGFEPRIAFQNDDYPAMLGFVAAGVGVALVPDMVTRGIRDDVVVRPLDPAPPPRPILVALPVGYRSPAAAAMLTVLREVSDEWVAGRSCVRSAPEPQRVQHAQARQSRVT